MRPSRLAKPETVRAKLGIVAPARWNLAIGLVRVPWGPCAPASLAATSRHVGDTCGASSVDIRNS